MYVAVKGGEIDGALRHDGVEKQGVGERLPAGHLDLPDAWQPCEAADDSFHRLLVGNADSRSA